VLQRPQCLLVPHPSRTCRPNFQLLMMPHSEQYIQLEVVVLAFPSLILDRVKEEPVCWTVNAQLRCELAEHTMHFVNRYTWVSCSALVRCKCVEVVAQLVNRLEVHLEEREVAAPCE